MIAQILPLPKFKLNEKQITAQIRAYLKMRGIFHWKVHQGLGSTPGVSDILGCFKGRLLCIEIKAPGGKLSPDQENFINQVNAEGGLAFVARSVEDVIEKLKGETDERLFHRGGARGALRRESENDLPPVVGQGDPGL